MPAQIRHSSLASLAAVALLAACAADVPTAPAEASLARSAHACTNVAGTIEGFAIPQFGPDGLTGFVVGGGATGPLAGAVSATLTIERVGAGGTIHFTASHTFAGTALGTLTTADRGSTTPDGRIHDALDIVGGGSGMLTTHGTVDATTGALALRYHGRVCE